jgi:four helix bundle protein
VKSLRKRRGFFFEGQRTKDKGLGPTSRAARIIRGLMARTDLQARTKAFALRVVKLADALPRRPSGSAIAYQLARSGTSVASNYRAACVARSKREFIAKLCIVCEEIDETQGWLDMVSELSLVRPQRLVAIRDEARQLTAIFITARKTSRGIRL